MPFLEILHFTGHSDRRELAKQTPITIGSHPSNDIAIDEEGVDIMHCRVSWSKTGFEAVAAGVAPLDVNGTPMQRTKLKSGDVLRFGSIDVRYREGDETGEAPAESAAPAEMGLKPLTEDIVRQKRSEAAATKPAKPARSTSAEKVPDLDLFASALDALAAESLQEIPTQRPAKERRAAAPAAPARPVDPPATNVDAAVSEAPTDTAATPPASAAPSPTDGPSERMRQTLRSRQRRPGDEDPLRSPLVLGLTGGAGVLVLAFLIFYFIGMRQTTQQAFDAARLYYDEGNYRSSIPALQEFIAAHPRTGLADEARVLLGSAKIRQQIEGGAPQYATGLEELRSFIDTEKDRDNFESLHPQITDYARTISLGAAEAAGKRFDPGLLKISDQARTILKTYAPKGTPPTETLDKIERTMRSSEAAILKDGVYKEQVAAIEQALARQQPLQALKARRDLLVRYPAFEQDRKVVALMQRTLEAEKVRTQAQDLNQVAVTEERPWPAGGLSLVAQSRTRQDEVAAGRGVIVIAEDCLYGLEMVTGAPLWRREIGFDTPFFPLVESTMPSVIAFDTRNQELVRLHQDTGALIWRQPLGTEVRGQPLLTKDALYVATADSRLISIDIASGQQTGELKFSQPVSGPVELQDEERLVVAGNEEVLYTLTKRPFACEVVSYLGQPAGSVQAPLLVMAKYLLLIQNGSSSSALRLLEVSNPSQPLTEAASGRVSGRVLDTPVIRGRDLFVPSTGERVSAFSLSDDPGQPPLTAGPVFQGEGRHQGPIFLLTGPDRQLWMATGSLSRLRLSTDSLQVDGSPIALGVATQPLQYISGYLFNARRRPYTQAVTITRTDRDELTSDWQAIVGSKILAWTARAGGSLNLAVMNSAGQAFRIGDRQLSDGRFLTEPTERLPLSPDLVTPLLAGTVPGDRIAVACGLPEPRIWILNAAGKIEASPQLPDAPQAAPSSIGTFTLVPLPGRVHVVRQSGQPGVQDFLLPTGENRRWVGVIPLGKNQSAGVTADGLVLLLRLNESPRPNVAEAARIEIGQRVKHLPVAEEGLFAIIDESQQLSLFETERLEPRGKRTFDQPLTNSPWIAGGRVFVEEAATKLHCVDPQSNLSSLWTLDLEQSPVVGILLHENRLLVARQDGKVLTVDPATGGVLQTFDTLFPLDRGPVPVGGRLFVATVDGTLIPLPASSSAQ